MKPGFWLIRCCRACPEVAARIWICHHEPGEPDNHVDQPYLQGQIGLDLVNPHEIWSMLEFCESSPAERQRMVAPPASDRAPRNGRQQGLTTAAMAKWKQERARRITAIEYEQQLEWLRWAERNAPDRPQLHYRRPVVLANIPIPTFGSTA